MIICSCDLVSIGENLVKYVSAWQNRKPARYAAGFGRAAVGMCRRVCYSDGSAKMWGDTNTASFTELEGGEMLVRKTTEEINRLFAAD